MKSFFLLNCLIASQLLCAVSYEQQMIIDFARYSNLPEHEKQRLLELADSTNKAYSVIVDKSVAVPLFTAYPTLREHISYVHLGSLPTPIHHCKKLGAQFNKSHLYIKCDNATGGTSNGNALCGGSKVRKLEFLLADALAHNARSVLTFGRAGSNHALATAEYAQKLGIEATLVLSDQPSSHIVRRNLLLDVFHSAQLIKATKDSERSVLGAQYCVQHKGQFCSFPYAIPVGGSCPRGILGFVNAAFELKEQIDAGMLPEPRFIIVPCGSTGTTVGLMLGCKAAGLKSIVVPIAVEPDDYFNEMQDGILNRFKDTVAFLSEYESSFSQYVLDVNELNLVRDFQGTEYGLFTPEAMEAIKIIKEVEDITLDGVYAGKAAAALLYVLRNSDNDVPLLFWDTFCDDSFSELIQKVRYETLPEGFQHYFTEDVQPLDR